MEITDTKVPIKRRWWEVLLLRRADYDHVRIINRPDGSQTVYVNGLLEEELPPHLRHAI